jgi:nucleotide-binding universal stress UspA family protein
MITIRHVLVPTDFSAASETALAYGRALASRFDAQLHVVTVVENFFRIVGVEGYFIDAGGHNRRDSESLARALLEAAVGGPEPGRSKTRAILLKSSTPGLAVVDYAGQHAIDLIIIGSHGHTGLAHRLMGGVAEEIVRLAPCPVLTVKPGEHEFLTADVETQAAATSAVSRRS